MQLKQTYSKYYEQTDKKNEGNTHQRPSVRESTPREERADANIAAQEHQLQLQEDRGTNQHNLQADKEFINPKQQKIDLTTYFEEV